MPADAFDGKWAIQETIVRGSLQDLRAAARAGTQWPVNTLHLLAKSQRTEAETAVVCRFFVDELGFDVNLSTDLRQTPLFYAARDGGEELCQQIVESKADVNAVDGNQQTPLFYCARYNNNVRTLVRLLKLRADPNHADCRGQTPIFYAAKYKSNGHVRALLTYNAKPNIEDKSGSTALFYSKSECLNLLLDLGCPVNHRNSTRQTALFWSACRGKSIETGLLLRGTANPNFKDDKKQTPLLFAAKNGHIEVCQALLSFNADPKIADVEGLTAKKVAECNGSADMRDLFSMFCRVCTKPRKRPSDHISSSGALLAEDELTGEDKKAKQARTSARLFRVARNGTLADLESLASARTIDMCATDSCGRTALHVAAKRRDAEAPALCRALISTHGVNADGLDNKQHTALSKAVSFSREETIKALLLCRCNPNVGRTASGLSALLQAVSLGTAREDGNIGIVSLLLEFDAHLDCVNTKGCTALFYAVSNPNFPPTVQLLLDAKAQADHQDSSHRTSLFYAKSVGAANLLIERRCDVHCLDNRLKSALFCAARAMQPPLIKCLLEHRANPNQTDDLGRSPLHRSLGMESTLLLVRANADVHHQDHNNQTPLFVSAANREETKEVGQSIQALLISRADVEARDHLSRTPLFYAMEKGSAANVQAMVTQGLAKATALDKDGSSPVDVLAREDPEKAEKLQYCEESRVLTFDWQDGKGREFNLRFVCKDGMVVPAGSEEYVRLHGRLIEKITEIRRREAIAGNAAGSSQAEVPQGTALLSESA